MVTSYLMFSDENTARDAVILDTTRRIARYKEFIPEPGYNRVYCLTNLSSNPITIVGSSYAMVPRYEARMYLLYNTASKKLAFSLNVPDGNNIPVWAFAFSTQYALIENPNTSAANPVHLERFTNIVGDSGIAKKVAFDCYATDEGILYVKNVIISDDAAQTKPYEFSGYSAETWGCFGSLTGSSNLSIANVQDTSELVNAAVTEAVVQSGDFKYALDESTKESTAQAIRDLDQIYVSI